MYRPPPRLLRARGGVEDGPADLGPPCPLFVRVAPTDQVVLTDRPVDGKGVLVYVGCQRAVRAVDVGVRPAWVITASSASGTSNGRTRPTGRTSPPAGTKTVASPRSSEKSSLA